MRRCYGSRSRRLRFLPWLLLVVPLGCATAPLANPAPVAAASTPARTRSAILRGVIFSHWNVQSDRPGEVVARLARGSWDMVVAIDYGRQITIHYVSSDDLRYDGSAHPPRIDRGYMKRVNRLMNAISRETVLADTVRSEQDPEPTLPPPGLSSPARAGRTGSGSP